MRPIFELYLPCVFIFIYRVMRKSLTILVLSVYMFMGSFQISAQVTQMSFVASSPYFPLVRNSIALLKAVSSTQGMAPVTSVLPYFPAVLVETPVMDASSVRALEVEEMQTAIGKFFGALENGSTKDMESACTKTVSIRTHLQDQTGNHHIFEEKIGDMIAFTASSGGNSFQTEVKYEIIPADATSNELRAPYKFYINGQLSHCGVCSFSLDKTAGEWRIAQMIDTRSRVCE